MFHCKPPVLPKKISSPSISSTTYVPCIKCGRCYPIYLMEGARCPDCIKVKEEKMDNYLIVVRYDSNCDTWVVDEDSRHVLESYGNGMTPQELQVCFLKALPQSVPWQDNLSNEEGPIFEWVFENPEWIGTMGLLYEEKDES